MKVTIPFDLVLDPKVSANAVRLYAVLQSFVIGKPKKAVNPAIVITHREMVERSNLSQKTLVKSLTQLENAGWISKQTNLGSANRYVLPNIAD